jgi:hypothetical protein
MENKEVSSTVAEKTVVPFEKWEKLIQSESAHLQYFDKMSRGEADRKAKEVISQRFILEDSKNKPRR